MEKESHGFGENVLELLLALVIIYFGLQATDAGKYYSSLVPHMQDKEGITYVMVFLYKYVPITNVILCFALVASCFLKKDDDAHSPALSIFLWGALGWWIGSEFTEAILEKQACLAKSTFGFGCTLNGPIFSYLAYCALSFYIAFIVVIHVVASLMSPKGNEKAEGE